MCSSNDRNPRCRELGLQLLCVVTLTFKLSRVWHQIFHKLKEKINKKTNSFNMYTIFTVCRMIAWPICNLCLNLFLKTLMSACAQVSKFGSSLSCKQSKFQQEIHSKWKMWMLNLKVEALCFKGFIVFLENVVLDTFICADNESKIKEIGWRLRFWDTGVAKTTYFLSKSHDLPHKVIREVQQININVL